MTQSHPGSWSEAVGAGGAGTAAAALLMMALAVASGCSLPALDLGDPDLGGDRAERADGPASDRTAPQDIPVEAGTDADLGGADQADTAGTDSGGVDGPDGPPIDTPPGPDGPDLTPCTGSGCCLTTADCAEGAVCEVNSGNCVQCLANADCAGSQDGPVCDTNLGTCQVCMNNSSSGTDRGCTSAAPACDVSITPRQCRLCLDDRGDSGDGPRDIRDSGCSDATPVCITQQSCVACTESSHCYGDGDSVAGVCGSDGQGQPACVACKDSPDCAGNPAGSLCNMATGQCSVCVVDSDCPVARAHCNQLANLCVACAIDNHCQAGEVCNLGVCQPKCSGVATAADNQCANRDPTLPFCDLSSGLCIGCRSDNDCPDTQDCESAVDRCVGPGAAIECLTSSDCDGDEKCRLRSVGGVQGSRCVECLVHTDCDADEHCGQDNRCTNN